MSDLGKLLGLSVLFLVAAYIAVGAMDVGPEVKRNLRRRILQGLLIALSIGLAVLLVAKAPLWVAGASLAGTLLATGALEAAGLAAGDATGARPLRCGDPGTCGTFMDGELCLSFECEV